jgi:hypothetical protein
LTPPLNGVFNIGVRFFQHTPGALVIVHVAVRFLEEVKGGWKAFCLFFEEGQTLVKMIAFCHGRFLLENNEFQVFLEV